MIEYTGHNRATPAQKAAAARAYLSAVPKHLRSGMRVGFTDNGVCSPTLTTRDGRIYFDARVQRAKKIAAAAKVQRAKAGR